MNSPIDIQIEDDRKYADVAFLVDIEGFLTDIAKVRKAWGLDKKLYPYDPTKPWLENPQWKETEEQLDEWHKMKGESTYEKLQDTNYTFRLTLEEKVNLLKEYRKKLRVFPHEAFRQDVQKLRKKYKKASNFDEVITHAIIYGVVPENAYKTVDIGIEEPEIEYIDFEKEEYPRIVFYPYTTIEDLEKIFKEKAKDILEKYQERLGGKIATYDHERGNIKRDRKWYWMKKSMSWAKLLKTVQEEDKQTIGLSGLRAAVEQYEQTLPM
jgi:hypothetical protein